MASPVTAGDETPRRFGGSLGGELMCVGGSCVSQASGLEVQRSMLFDVEE